MWRLARKSHVKSFFRSALGNTLVGSWFHMTILESSLTKLFLDYYGIMLFSFLLHFFFLPSFSDWEWLSNLVTSCSRKYGISTSKLLSRLICFFIFDFLMKSIFIKIPVPQLLFAVMLAGSASKSDIHETGLYWGDHNGKYVIWCLKTTCLIFYA